MIARNSAAAQAWQGVEDDQIGPQVLSALPVALAIGGLVLASVLAMIGMAILRM
ncbi:hypothetical protein LWE61_04960 [Sphingobium sufflavum]|uniref:hypothetical protein n=1 Tax=Sphingobium sufflavum TaxID=1129547 RepID=UPI001F1DB0D0|nr:hypothetical protein [Sphingobium sufflavum]MCE7795909.1 hypothetical protein [Sphingobium sufflavum]